MQDSLFGDGIRVAENLETLEKSFSDQDYIKMLEDELEMKEAFADDAFGHLAVTFDFIGQMVIALNKGNGEKIQLSEQALLDSVDALFGAMTGMQRQAVRDAVQFHFHTKKFTNPYPNNSLEWHEIYPMNLLRKVNFDNVINSYALSEVAA